MSGFEPEDGGANPPRTTKMIIKLSETEYSLLLMSSVSCEYCDDLYKKYNKNKQFDTYDLSLREMIHIETTTRRRDIVPRCGLVR